MNEKYSQAKSIIDFLSVSEVKKLLEYCKRNFPKAYRRIQPEEAESIKEIDRTLSDIVHGKPIVLSKIMDAIEHDILLRALVKYKKQVKAAQNLGLKEQTLRYKMMRLKIPTMREHQDFYLRSKESQGT
jgi:transcriptional regulator with GAF, ATPase, and Fis domain